MTTSLEVTLRTTSAGQVALVVSREGRVDESYRPVSVDVALEAAGFLVRGCEPPRALLCRRDVPGG